LRNHLVFCYSKNYEVGTHYNPLAMLKTYEGDQSNLSNMMVWIK